MPSQCFELKISQILGFYNLNEHYFNVLFNRYIPYTLEH